MPQWSGKIPEKISFQSSLVRLLKNKNVIDFQENSRKFVVQILSNNLALNCSGAFFFIGIGYSLKWWYKEHFFVALLKQNLPALSEPQQRVSWETSMHVLKEQNSKFVEKRKSVFIGNQRSNDFASSSWNGSMNKHLGHLEGATNSGKIATCDKKKSFTHFSMPYGIPSSDQAKLTCETQVKTNHFLRSTGGKKVVLSETSFFDSLLQRLDLYTNHVGVTFKSPWEKHMFQRFVGVFSQSPQVTMKKANNGSTNQPRGSTFLKDRFAQGSFPRYTSGEQLFPETCFKLSARGFYDFSKESVAIGKLSYPLQLTGFVHQDNLSYLGRAGKVLQSRWSHVHFLGEKFRTEYKKDVSTLFGLAGWQPSLDALFLNSYLDEIPHKLESTLSPPSNHDFASETSAPAVLCKQPIEDELLTLPLVQRGYAKLSSTGTTDGEKLIFAQGLDEKRAKFYPLDQASKSSPPGVMMATRGTEGKQNLATSVAYGPSAKRGEKILFKGSQLVGMKQLLKSELEFLINSFPLTFVDKVFCDKTNISFSNFLPNSRDEKKKSELLTVPFVHHQADPLVSKAELGETMATKAEMVETGLSGESVKEMFSLPGFPPSDPYPSGMGKGMGKGMDSYTSYAQEQQALEADHILSDIKQNTDRKKIQNTKIAEILTNLQNPFFLDSVKTDFVTHDPLFLLNSLHFTFNNLSSLNNPPLLLPSNSEASLWMWKSPICQGLSRFSSSYQADPISQASIPICLQKKSTRNVFFRSIGNLKGKSEKSSIWEILQPLGYEKHVESIEAKKEPKEFRKLFNQRDNVQKVILKQKKVTLANIDFINRLDKQISCENKKSRLMSGYTYPDIQSNSLQTTLYYWLSKRPRLSFLNEHCNQILLPKTSLWVRNPKVNTPEQLKNSFAKKTENIGSPYADPRAYHLWCDRWSEAGQINKDWSKANKAFNGSNSSVKKANYRAVNAYFTSPSKMVKVNPIDCKVLDQAYLTSIKIPITPTTFLFRFFQQHVPKWEIGEKLSKADHQRWFAYSSEYNDLLTASNGFVNSSPDYFLDSDVLSRSRHAFVTAHAQGKDANASKVDQLSVPFKRTTSALQALHSEDKVCMDGRRSHGYWVESEEQNPANIAPLSFFLFPYQKFNHHFSSFPGFSKPHEFVATLPQNSHGTDIGVPNNSDQERMGKLPIGSFSPNHFNSTGSISADSTIHFEKRAIAENATDSALQTDRLGIVELGIDSKLGLTKQGKTLFDCNKRKIAYSGVAVQRNALTKDLQPSSEKSAIMQASVDSDPSSSSSYQAYPSGMLGTPCQLSIPLPFGYGSANHLLTQRLAKLRFAKLSKPYRYAEAKACDAELAKRSGELEQSSIWGTLFLGSRNPLNNRQCHFFGQRQLSPLNTTHFQRDYLRQLGKETIDQANLKGFPEKASSTERAKILSFSKRANSFFFKKRKYTYLLEKKDQWHLLFQEQLRAALEDSKKYPPLLPEEMKENDSERIKISAPLVLVRIPILKPESNLPNLLDHPSPYPIFLRGNNNTELPFYVPPGPMHTRRACLQSNAGKQALLAKERGCEAPVLKKWYACKMAQFHHNLFWRPFSYIKPPGTLSLENFDTIRPISSSAYPTVCCTSYAKQTSKAWEEDGLVTLPSSYPYPYPYPSGMGKSMASKAEVRSTGTTNGNTFDGTGWTGARERTDMNKQPDLLVFHYPLLTERPCFELNNAFSLKKNVFPGFKGGKVSSFFQWLIQEPLTTNSWSVLSQWFFLLSLLFWIEQTLLENVFPALFALEQALLGGTGLKVGDRAHVVRISKGARPTFQDLAGIDGLLGELSELVLFLRGHKEHFWNRKSSYGVLLTGPPGTGKTFLVRALANEAGVPVLILSVGNLVANKLNSSKPSWSIRHAFRRAKQLAPCILFIDEIDALGKSRGNIVTDVNEVIADTTLGNLGSHDFSHNQFTTAYPLIYEGKRARSVKEEKEQLMNTIFDDQTNTLLSRGVSRQNWPAVPTRLTTEWAYPLQSTIVQESHDIAHYSLCEEKLLDLLKTHTTGQILTNKAVSRMSNTNGASDTLPKSFPSSGDPTELGNPSFPSSIGQMVKQASHKQSNNVDSTSSTSSPPIENGENNSKRKFGPLTQLLLSMDGVSSLSGILIMGATNRPELLDPALTRPGRFERIIRIEKPSEQKRIEILQLYSRNLGVQHLIPWSYLANRTKGLTVADLAVAMNYSSLKAILQKSVHTIETIEYGLDSITRSSVRTKYSFGNRKASSHLFQRDGSRGQPSLLSSLSALRAKQPQRAFPMSAPDRLGRYSRFSESIPVEDGTNAKLVTLPSSYPYPYPYPYPSGMGKGMASKAEVRSTGTTDGIVSLLKAEGQQTSIREPAVAQSFHRLAQIAYYQAGKIVIQTLLPHHPPVAFAMVNLFGITSSTSLDIHIPNTGASSTQCCASLEDRLIGLYGGKAALQLFEYQHLLGLGRTSFFSNFPPFLRGISYQNAMKSNNYPATRSNLQRISSPNIITSKGSVQNTVKMSARDCQNNFLTVSFAGAGSNFFQSNIGNIEIQKATQLAGIMVNNLDLYSLNVYTTLKNSTVCATSNTLTNKVKTDFLNITSNHFKKHQQFLPTLYAYKALSPSAFKHSLLKLTLPSSYPYPYPYPYPKGKGMGKGMASKAEVRSTGTIPSSPIITSKDSTVKGPSLQSPLLLSYQAKLGTGANTKQVAQPVKANLQTKVKWGIKNTKADSSPHLFPLGISDLAYNVTAFGGKPYKVQLPLASVALLWKNKQLDENCLRFAILQAKSYFKASKGYEDAFPLVFAKSAYSSRRISVESGFNFGLSANNQFTQGSRFGVFQLLHSLQVSNVNRDRFYPGWFRLYLPDVETTDFQKNVSNSFFSLGVETFIRPSTTKSTTTGVLCNLSIGVGLLRNIAKERNRTKQPLHTLRACEAGTCFAEKNNFSSFFSLNKENSNVLSRKGQTLCNVLHASFFPGKRENKFLVNSKREQGTYLYQQKWVSPSFLLAEKQLFSKGVNIVSCTEKELISRALVNNCYTKAFLFINQNRQLLDYFVDCLIRFQILRQHEILFLFSVILLNCKK